MASIAGDTTGFVTGTPPNMATGDLDIDTGGVVTSQNWVISSPPSFGTATVDPNTGTWTYTVDPTFFDSLDDGVTAEDTFTIQATGVIDFGLLSLPFDLSQPITVTIEGVCFTAGTLIETDTDERAVETLTVGDKVTTMDRGPQPIRWIESAVMSAETLRDNPALRPVRIRAGSLGPGRPKRDLLVSQQHRLLIKGPKVELLFGVQEVLVAAKHLCTWAGISVETADTPVEYFHILLDNHEILLAEAAEAESLFLGEEALHTLSQDALAELAAIFPNLPEQNRFSFGRTARLILREFEAQALA